MTHVVRFNGLDSEALGLRVSRVAPWSSVQFEHAHIPIPLRVGGVGGRVSTSPPRTLSIEGYWMAATALDRAAMLDRARAHLLGLVEVEVGDLPGRMLVGRAQVVDGGQLTMIEYADGVPGWLAARIDIVCDDPAWTDVYAQSVAGADTPTPVPLGTLPSGGAMYLYGPATDPEVRYRGVTGNVLGGMGFTVTLTDDDYLRLDLSTQRIRLVEAGVESDGYGLLTAGEWFHLDPGDGLFGHQWPTLECSSGTWVYQYQRRWS